MVYILHPTCSKMSIPILSVWRNTRTNTWWRKESAIATRNYYSNFFFFKLIFLLIWFLFFALEFVSIHFCFLFFSYMTWVTLHSLHYMLVHVYIICLSLHLYILYTVFCFVVNNWPEWNAVSSYLVLVFNSLGSFFFSLSCSLRVWLKPLVDDGHEGLERARLCKSWAFGKKKRESGSFIFTFRGLFLPRPTNWTWPPSYCDFVDECFFLFNGHAYETVNQFIFFQKQ